MKEKEERKVGVFSPLAPALPGDCTLPPKASAPIRWPFPAANPLTKFQETFPFLVPLGIRSGIGFLLLTLPSLVDFSDPCPQLC